MAQSNITFTDKVENSGATADGRVSAANLNEIKDAVNSTAGVVIQKVFSDSPYTASWGEDLEIDCTAGAVTVNMPTAVGSNGATITVTKVDGVANNITVDGATTETINGDLTSTITAQYTSVTYKSNGTNIGIR